MTDPIEQVRRAIAEALEGAASKAQASAQDAPSALEAKLTDLIEAVARKAFARQEWLTWDELADELRVTPALLSRAERRNPDIFPPRCSLVAGTRKDHRTDRYRRVDVQAYMAALAVRGALLSPSSEQPTAVKPAATTRRAAPASKRPASPPATATRVERGDYLGEY